MLVLGVGKVSKNFGYGPLFEDVSFSLNDGERISIVGANGCGKSALLKMIANIETCDAGSISLKKGAKVAYLDQTLPDKSDDRLVYDIIQDAFEDLLKLQKEMEDAYTKIEQVKETDEYNNLIEAAELLQEEFQEAGGYNIETSINIICNGLNISDEMRLQNYNTLSGGEKTLVHIAKSLLQNPDLFLLNEPTNHLDIDRIEWLEGYLKEFKGAIVIVSHDRSFLDNISNKILEIDNGEGVIYNTNYTGYLEEKEKRYEKLIENYEEQQKYFKRFEDQAKRMAQAGMATNSHVMTRKASVLFNRIEREKAKIAIKPLEKKREVKITFDELRKNSNRVIELKKLTISLPQKDIVKDIDMFIFSKERVAIIGENGSGKSSIIKAILGSQTLPFTGDVIISPSVKVGYLPQIIKFENNKESLLKYFQKEIEKGEEIARSILSRFLFTKDDVQKRMGDLSGGERIRVRLAILLQQKINTLIFDEPTNHIDIPTKESLEEALENFNGTLLFISHDRFFINKFAHRVIEVKDTQLTNYIGNYNDYAKSKNS